MLAPFTGSGHRLFDGSAKAHEHASAARYAVDLTRYHIHAELTATRLAALHLYRFPRTDAAKVMLDASSVIALLAPPNRQRPVRTRLCPAGRRGLDATVSAVDGWLHPGPYTLHAAVRFDRPMRGMKRHCTVAGRGRHLRAVARFDARRRRVVRVKVGLSFVGRRKALRNLRREIPGWRFRSVQLAAEKRWRRVLSQLEVRGGTARQRRMLATALFHTHLMPHDLTGENAWWRSGTPHYEDYYGLWDTHRALHPLLLLLQPRRERDTINSLVETFQHTGWMPDTRIAGNNGLTQGGSNGDVLVADAVQKQLRGVRYRTAYRALRKNAEVDSRRPLYEGRQVSEYKRRGYLSTDLPRSASRTVEYAHEDFGVYNVARLFGKNRAAARYRKRASYWANLWDPAALSVRPRLPSGEFMPHFDRTHFYPDRATPAFDAPFYEGSGWQYSTYIPHDVEGLIQRVGGDAAFVTWLDHFFAADQYIAANEVTTLAPFLYIHAGRPDLTSRRVRDLLNSKYGTGHDGLPGNDDAGALSAWFIWASIGLFPNAGEPYYYLTAPVFTKTTIRLQRGRRFIIEAPGASETTPYITGARLNGRRLDRAWLRHDELARGGRLELDLSNKPGGWGQSERPPSLTPSER
jgi:predicted alpha-1,2-mannosidase